MGAASRHDRLYRTCLRLIRFLLHLFTRSTRIGTAHIPRSGPVIVAGNHISTFDPVALAATVAAAGRRPRAMATAGLFTAPVLGPLLLRCGLIPVHRRSTNAAAALEPAAAALRAGEVVMLYPEGKITTDPNHWPLPAKTGVVRLALDTGAPVEGHAVVTSRRVTLGEVCTVRSSLVDPTLPENQDQPHIAPDSIERDTGRLLGYRTVAQDGVMSGNYKFEAGDLLYSKIRPNLNKATLVDFSGLCSADMYALNLNRAQVAPSFVAHLLRSQGFLSFATSLSNRANIPKLNRGQLLAFQFELPPLDEQRRIAAILDEADALRAKRHQVLAHFDDLSQSIFVDMFGDPITNPRGWPQIPLGDLLWGVESGRSPVCESRPAESDEWGILKLGAVTYGVFNEAENKAYLGDSTSMASNEVRPGDLLMTRKNASGLVGAVALVGKVRSKLLLPDLIFRLVVRDEHASKDFLQALLMNPRKRQEVRGLASGSAGSMPNISKARLQGLPVVVPPVGLQRQFANRMQAVRSQRAEHGDQASRGLELVRSLQARAFSGRL